ncbi:MAG TPA: cytochrome c biogenesis protein CcdA [Symbiobacteriaceae bacterium]
MESANLLIALATAFGAGVLSFLTPCCLPIYPAFLSYVTGVSIQDLHAGSVEVRRRVLAHSLAFFAGFSTIYVAMGLAASALGTFFAANRDWLPVAGGLWVTLMGLTLLGVVKIPFLMRERRIQLARRPEGYFGTVLVGLAYAAGWTPCVGPILGAVITLAAIQPGRGGLLLLAYSVGFAVPFVLLAYALGSARALARYAPLVERVGGGLMVVTGLLLATGYWQRLSAWFSAITTFRGF